MCQSNQCLENLKLLPQMHVQSRHEQLSQAFVDQNEIPHATKDELQVGLDRRSHTILFLLHMILMKG